jgi:hypothetical protein
MHSLFRFKQAVPVLLKTVLPNWLASDVVFINTLKMTMYYSGLTISAFICLRAKHCV